MFWITVQHNPSEHELQAMNNGQTFSFMSPNYSFVQALKQLFMNGVVFFISDATGLKSSKSSAFVSLVHRIFSQKCWALST